MRIVIDLPDGLQAATLDEIRQFAQWAQTTPVKHEIFLALCQQQTSNDPAQCEAFTEQVETARQALANWPVQVMVYDLPSAYADSDANSDAPNNWLIRAREAIRENFLAGLKPDVVYLPSLPPPASPTASQAQTVFSIGPQSADFHTVVRLAAHDNANDNANETHDPETRLRYQTSLSKASLCLHANDNAITHISALLPQPRDTESNKHKPRLAFISPLPPEKSGVADYSAELIPHLAKYYQIELILDQASLDAPWISAHLPVRSVAWFRAHASRYQHLLYHVGNSPMHQHMFALFEQHPGIIVLHDFYLGNILGHLDQSGYLPGIFTRALYQSHGWSALLAQQQTGFSESTWNYPCNRIWLEQAQGVIVHSNYPRQLAQQWYGPQAAADWHTIPHLRNPLTHQTERNTARAELKLPWLTPEAYIICSFGMLGPTKANHQVLDAWLQSPLANDPLCHLIFVGENDGGSYGSTLKQRIQTQTHIHITDFVSTSTYRTWLQAANGAVQLRTHSRGETSGAILDCLLYGLPTIINAHGSAAELPDHAVIKLPDAITTSALANALEQLWQSPILQQNLKHAAQNYLHTNNAPETIAAQYHKAIEHFAQHGQPQTYRRLLQDMQQISTFNTTPESTPDTAPTQTNYLDCAAAIAANQPARAPRQCLIDISAMVQTDLKTGIQRVVRSIMMELLRNPPAGFRAEPVYTRGGEPYHYARQYLSQQLGLPEVGLPDAPVEIQHGDVFLGLDLFMEGTFLNRQRLQTMRNHGVEIIFIVYDILPLLRPDVFPVGTEDDFSRWLGTIAKLSDGLLCISKAVTEELAHWLHTHPVPRQRPLALGYFHLGADIAASVPSTGLPDNAEQILHTLRTRPSIVMVGTVEPRKAQAQALAAFELLWAQGVDVNLVIVGKQGWMMESLAKRLKQHPENGQRLFWLQGPSDEMLLAVYQSVSALLAASEGEGFGLPLIEAAQHQLPIIARAIPVFKEVSGDHAFYFDGLQANDLAQAIQTWLNLYQSGQAPTSNNMPWLTWEQSAQQLKTVIWEQRWLTYYATDKA